MMRPDDADPLAAYLRHQVEAVFAAAPGVPEVRAVHRTRVAIRRLRSTLKVFAPLLTLAQADLASVDEELRWYAGLLGEIRDGHVQRDRFALALGELPPEQVLGPVAEQIGRALDTEQARAEEAIARASTSERCVRLRELLATWRRHPPVGEVHARALRRRARRAARKADRRLAVACESGTGADLHRARKAAKRARYAGEVLRAVGGGKKQRRRFKRIQGRLGDVQDAMVAAEALLRLAGAFPAGRSGFTLGVLHARERAQAKRLLRRVCAARQ